ncbi:Fc.00g078690.m01.CDS01 [Cosmosporella sp. VM-42]
MAETNDWDTHDAKYPFNIPATLYAPSYQSTYTIPESGFLTKDDIALLKHINCSYLSNEKPPTLLALKQHAHSLVNLIAKLSVTQSFAPVPGANAEDLDLANEAYDWLVRLDAPYENDDESHHVPLWAVANTIKGESEIEGIEHHCPMKTALDLGPLSDEDGKRRPYQTHHSLVMHTNECLEILDHEYGATGGLMSLLPTDHEADTEQLRAARNTLLGQWLMHHQHLVGRMHELEINYANALDILGGEAVVPLEMIRAAGPDGLSKGREIAYPQDKYILVNSGDAVTEHLHRLMDKAEAEIEQKEKVWKASGVSGERMWMQKGGGDWYSRGLVPVDCLTRFYRVKEKGSGSPIFVLPAIEQHPDVAYTRKIENRPTVVSVVTPTWPERVSDFEAKYKARLDKATETEILNQKLVRERLEWQDMVAVKNAELRKNTAELAFWEKTVGKDERRRYGGLLAEIKAYNDKMDELRRKLPSDFHNLLDINRPEDNA